MLEKVIILLLLLVISSIVLLGLLHFSRINELPGIGIIFQTVAAGILVPLFTVNIYFKHSERNPDTNIIFLSSKNPVEMVFLVEK